MKLEVSIDCADDTGRIPKGNIIVWKIHDDNLSRDAKIRVAGDIIIEALKKRWPKPRDGITKVGKVRK